MDEETGRAQLALIARVPSRQSAFRVLYFHDVFTSSASDRSERVVSEYRPSVLRRVVFYAVILSAGTNFISPTSVQARSRSFTAEYAAQSRGSQVHLNTIDTYRLLFINCL